MRVLKKVIYAVCLMGLVSSNAIAIEFSEALSKAYTSNPKIKSLQSDYISLLQKFPEAISSGFLPDIRYVQQSSNTKSRLRDYPQLPASRKKSFSKGIQVKQNLFAGGAGIANLAAAKYQIDMGRIKYLTSEQQFFMDGIKIYTQFIASQEKLEASKSFVLSNQRQYEAEQEKMKVGQSTSTDVAYVKSQYSKALYDNARYTASFASAKSAFIAFFNCPPEDLKLPDLPEGLPVDYDNFKQNALASNLSLKYLSLNLKAQRSALRSAQAHLLPTLDASLSCNEGYDYTVSPPTSKHKIKSYNTALTLNVPILSSGGAEYSRIRAENAKLRSVTYALDSTNNQIDYELITHWEEFESAKLALTFAEEMLEARSLAYEGTKTSFDVGLRSLLDVLNAEKELYEAKSQLIDSKQNVIVSSYVIKSDLAQLVAKNMNLGTKIFDPELEFRKTKIKIIGF